MADEYVYQILHTTGNNPLAVVGTGLRVVPSNGTSEAQLIAAADASTNPTAFQMLSFPLEYNGASFDRRRNNMEGTLLSSTNYTATSTSANQTNYNACGVMVTVNVTVAGSSGATLTPTVYGIDPVSSTAYILAQSTASTGVGIFALCVYPAAATGGSVVAKGSVPLPRTWKASVIHSSSSVFTYSIGYSYTL